MCAARATISSSCSATTTRRCSSLAPGSDRHATRPWTISATSFNHGDEASPTSNASSVRLSSSVASRRFTNPSAKQYRRGLSATSVPLGSRVYVDRGWRWRGSVEGRRWWFRALRRVAGSLTSGRRGVRSRSVRCRLGKLRSVQPVRSVSSPARFVDFESSLQDAASQQSSPGRSCAQSMCDPT